MILTCPACQTRYEADAAKFPPQGRDVRCARCGNTWRQAPPEPEPEVFFAPPVEPEPMPPSYQPEEPQADYYVQPPARDEEPQYQEDTVQQSEARSVLPRWFFASRSYRCGPNRRRSTPRSE